MVENAIFTLKTQIMATLTLVIVPAKRLSDGTHKIRIRVAHNSETRFITTDIVVRENEFKNGKIVHRPDKDFLNTDNHAVSCQSVAEHYCMDGKQLQSQYKDHLSDFQNWEQQSLMAVNIRIRDTK